MGTGNEWQEALAKHYADDYLRFLVGVSMEPSTYQDEITTRKSAWLASASAKLYLGSWLKKFKKYR